MVLVYKSGLRILIRAPEVPFLAAPKWLKLAKMTRLCILVMSFLKLVNSLGFGYFVESFGEHVKLKVKVSVYP